MKIALASALFALASFAAAASGPAPHEYVQSDALEPAAESESSPLLVDFQLYIEGRKPFLLMSSTIAASEDQATPTSVSRENAFVAAVEEVDGVHFMIPAVHKDGVSVLVDRKDQDKPVLVLKVVSDTDVQPATKPGETGVAESVVFMTSWPVVAGTQEHRFKANGKRYRAVIETK